MSLMRLSSRARAPTLGPPPWTGSPNAGGPPKIASSATGAVMRSDMLDDFGRRPVGHHAVGEILQDEGPGAHEGVGANPDAFLDERANADPGAPADLDVTGQVRAAGNVHPVLDD